jgi:diguanylate cyclase (GGDEF)-like protein
MIDNASLLIGIAFSSAALVVALLIGWLNARQETYLVHGATGIALIVLALGFMGLRNGAYDLVYLIVPFTTLIAGFACIYSTSLWFNRPSPGLTRQITVGAIAIVATAVPLVLGYSGIGTLALNLAGAVIMMLCALEYFWRSGDDQRTAMLAIAGLYTLVAVSFAACAAVLAIEGQWVLSAPPDNWAEDFNSISSLVGLTGIGAITLTLHHAREARRHRLEAATDSLTGVLNRRALFEQIAEHAIVPGLPVLMFDLDHFKQINDRLGHAAGDRVLQQFADVLRAEMGEGAIVARLGGEEFCALLPELDGERARDAAERTRAGFAALAIAIGDRGETATVSAGLATGGADETFSSVLNRADAALYKAKSAGRNQVHLASLRRVA